MAAAWRRSALDPHAATRVLNHSWGVQTPSSWEYPRSLRGVGDSLTEDILAEASTRFNENNMKIRPGKPVGLIYTF
jgi:hypothetical protein